eukprot:999114-Pleurochrysis_carterae.AAC.1
MRGARLCRGSCHATRTSVDRSTRSRPQLCRTGLLCAESGSHTRAWVPPQRRSDEREKKIRRVALSQTPLKSVDLVLTLLVPIWCSAPVPADTSWKPEVGVSVTVRV